MHSNHVVVGHPYTENKLRLYIYGLNNNKILFAVIQTKTMTKAGIMCCETLPMLQNHLKKTLIILIQTHNAHIFSISSFVEPLFPPNYGT